MRFHQNSQLNHLCPTRQQVFAVCEINDHRPSKTAREMLRQQHKAHIHISCYITSENQQTVQLTGQYVLSQAYR